jgi:hypothetical protein
MTKMTPTSHTRAQDDLITFLFDHLIAIPRPRRLMLLSIVSIDLSVLYSNTAVSSRR